MNREELDLLETGLLVPAVIPEITRTSDGRLRVGYRCPDLVTGDVADAEHMMVTHTEARP